MVLERMAIEFYSYLYTLQENGIQHELYNSEEKKGPSFIPLYVQWKFLCVSWVSGIQARLQGCNSAQKRNGFCPPMKSVGRDGP